MCWRVLDVGEKFDGGGDMGSGSSAGLGLGLALGQF